MYICLCNGYTDKHLRRKIREEGASSVDSLYESLGGAVCCGACCECTEALIEQESASSGALLAAE